MRTESQLKGLQALSNLPLANAEAVFTPAVRQVEPGLTAVEEVDYEQGIVIFTVGAERFAREFTAEYHGTAGNTDLHIGVRRDAFSHPYGTPPDAYAAGRAPAAPTDATGYEAALAALRATGGRGC